MDRMVKQRPFSLRIIQPGDELTGVAPPVVERSVKRCKSGDPTHRALVHLSATIAARGVGICMPPSAREPLEVALDVAHRWVRGETNSERVRKTRSETFAAVVAAEQKSVEAVRASLEAASRKKHNRLDPHADLIVVRYAGLAAAHACGAVLMTLDGVDDAEQLALVGQQVAGAIAYLETGLGGARSAELRTKTCEVAEWEAERRGAPADHGAGGIAIQLLHEYLGARWKNRSDGHRAHFDAFSEWALVYAD